MKNILIIIVFTLLSFLNFSCNNKPEENNQILEKTKSPDYTTITILNSSDQDSVKVFVTLPATYNIMGLFGIKDTISKSKGFFYAYKGKKYVSNQNPLIGGVIAFEGDAQGCESAIQNGFKTGINIFEFTVGVQYETFDISCEDGVNCIMKVTVSDQKNWSTGSGSDQMEFLSSQNKFPIQDNCNIRGVFPYRCTDCVEIGAQPPKNCFDLPAQCNKSRFCQAARTGHNGGDVMVEFIKSCK